MSELHVPSETNTTVQYRVYRHAGFNKGRNPCEDYEDCFFCSRKYARIDASVNQY
jgi:hypothetical protein